jgi:hypothetical protein
VNFNAIPLGSRPGGDRALDCVLGTSPAMASTSHSCPASARLRRRPISIATPPLLVACRQRRSNSTASTSAGAKMRALDSIFACCREGVSWATSLSSAVEAPSAPRPNVPRRVARRHSTRPGAFVRLPTTKAFAGCSHKASTQHDVPTAAGIVYEILRDKWS